MKITLNWRVIAGVLMATAIALGAFGSHSLKAYLSDYSMDIYNKASLYHFLNTLGLLAIADKSNISTKIILLTGIVIFSGSLYLLAITDLKFLGAITPVGGILLIAGWLLYAFKK